MRILRLTFALTTFALLLPSSRAQDAVLVIAPSATVSPQAGTGKAGFSGDGAAASTAQLAAPSAMARDTQGNLYIADTRNHRVRRIATDGTIATVAGTGTQGFAGDEGPASQAQLNSPAGIAVASDGTLYIADTHNQRVRHVDSNGLMHTVAGTGTAGFSGDGNTATAAQMSSPLGLAPGLTGDLYIADSANHRVRHIGANGTIATVAGDGAQGISPDGTQATAAHLDTPAAISVRSDGSVLIADRGNNRIFILQSDGTLHTLNTASVSLRHPAAVTTNTFGDTLIADTGNYRIAQISSSGAGSALGSGVQGLLDSTAAPNQTALGAPVTVLDTSPGSTSAQFATVDRDSSQVIQVRLPQLTFPDTVVATSSASRTLLLRNAGSATLSISSVAIPASFTASTSSCGTAPFQLLAGASCSIGLIFTPQSNGVATGLLQVEVQNAPPQRIALSGTGLPTGTQLTSSTSLQTSGSLTYAGTPLALTAAVLGSSATAATGTVTFLDGPTELGSGTLNPAAQATLTTSTLAAGAHTITARYNGNASYLGSVSAGTPITVAIPPDFTVAAPSGNQVTLPGGSTGTLSFVLQPVSGVLNQTVAVIVSGLPAGSAINVTPVPVMLAGDPVAVTVAFRLPVALSANSGRSVWLAGVFPFLLIGLRKRRMQALLPTSLIFLTLLLQGCGGGYLSGNASVGAQSAGSTYPVTVTASCTGVAGATLTHSLTYTVVVKQ